MRIGLQRFGVVVLLLASLIACGAQQSPTQKSEAPKKEATVAEATKESVPTSAPAVATTAAMTTTAAAEPTAAMTTTAAAEPTAAMTTTAAAEPTAKTSSWKPRELTASLNGSGASFPDPIYQKWIAEYQTVASGVTINYQPVGSGQGIKDFTGDITDFGGSDKFIGDKDLETYGKKVLHIPTVLGAVVATYNLPGMDKIQFSGETLAEIFLGTITKWNDPKIAADNPGTTLPDKAITVVHRSDGSGTTSIFTNYLSSVSAEWKDKVGAGTTVEWPVGIGGEKNPGVAQAVKQTEGAIGYVELIYAIGNKLPAPAIKNAAGKYVVPSLESTSEAAAGFLKEMPDDLRVDIVNPPEGDNAYPIAGFTWLLVREEMTDQTKAEALTDFIYWALTEGSATAKQLGYAPLPDSVREKAVEKLTMVKVDGKSVFTLP